MNYKRKIILIIFIIGSISFIGGMTLAQRNMIIRQREKIEQQYLENEQQYNILWDEFNGFVFIPEEHSNKIETLYKDLICGRSSSVHSLFKSIHILHPEVSEDFYIQLKDIIDYDRNLFSGFQKTIKDLIDEHNEMINSKILLRIIGKKTLDDKNYLIIN